MSQQLREQLETLLVDDRRVRGLPTTSRTMLSGQNVAIGDFLKIFTTAEDYADRCANKNVANSSKSFYHGYLRGVEAVLNMLRQTEDR